jgi:hypothetical protein
MSGFGEASAATATRSLIEEISQVTGQLPGRSVVVRGGVEPPTFRFSEGLSLTDHISSSARLTCVCARHGRTWPFYQRAGTCHGVSLRPWDSCGDVTPTTDLWEFCGATQPSNPGWEYASSVSTRHSGRDEVATPAPRAGHALVQNLRRSHYEIATDVPDRHRLRAAFDQLAIIL